MHINLVGAAAEALMGGSGQTGLKASSAGSGTSLLPPVAAAAAASGAVGAAGDGGDSWNEGDDRALVEALKKCGKDLPDR